MRIDPNSEREKANGQGRDNRLWRHFRQVKKLPPAQRKPIIQVLDAFLQGTAPKRGKIEASS